MSRLRDRVVTTAGTRGEATLYELDRATEMMCARCAGRSATKWIAVPGRRPPSSPAVRPAVVIRRALDCAGPGKAPVSAMAVLVPAGSSRVSSPSSALMVISAVSIK
ncbi:MAG TPA: hypothetical protein VFO01_09125 [Trebonia sp.]|nr:hypothetical protein [Trebonia sp.]